MAWGALDVDLDAKVILVMTIRLVLFDAFSTLLVPRLPVYVQYSQTFEPYLGVLEPEKLRSSFKIGRSMSSRCGADILTVYDTRPLGKP